MDHYQAWNAILGQLQMEMPRASFDTWLRDTEAIALEEDVMTVAVRNADTRDWLASRLTSTVQRLLVGVMNRSVSVQFLVRESVDQEQEPIEDEEEPEVAIEPVGWLDYERTVQPHKQVVVKGYLRRLGREIGPKAIWMYIGFHQAAWRVHALGKQTGLALHSREIIRFSGLSFGAFWRLQRHPATQSQLDGLVQRVDPVQVRGYRRGRDGRPHRMPVRYRVSMTPRLTRADSAAVYSRLKTLLDQGLSIGDVLRELLAVEDIMELLTPGGPSRVDVPLTTVMDMARLEGGESFTPEVDHLAQELQRRIINSLGDIHITHYFITQVIHEYNLTPAQAWLITVARDLAYLNWRTGERREVVTFKQGYEEMATLIGSKRYKTVQAWFNPAWTSQQRGGDLTRFLQEVGTPESNTYPDLRVGSMPRRFRVLLDEPLDANGSHMVDADGTNSRTQVEGVAGANGGNMVDANGTVLNTTKHPLNTNQYITSTLQDTLTSAAGGAPSFWELRKLLEQNDVHPKVQRELLETRASVQAFISWVLYVASPQSGSLSDPLGYALSRVRQDPLRAARGVFRQLASLPPAELLVLIDATPSRPHEPPKQNDHPLAQEWKKAMGSHNALLPTVRVILFGEGAS